jgi:hypothetical protein
MRLASGDVRGPHRFTQKRPRTIVSALRGFAAVETSKNQLSRNFWSRSIFDFCNDTIDFHNARDQACLILPAGSDKHRVRRIIAGKILECAHRGDKTLSGLTAAGYPQRPNSVTRKNEAGGLSRKSEGSARLSRLILRFPQSLSLRSVLNTRSTWRFKARMTTMRAIMIGPLSSTTRSRASTAACHSSRFCFFQRSRCRVAADVQFSVAMTVRIDIACWPTARACCGAKGSGSSRASPIKARAGRIGKSSNGIGREQGNTAADCGC